MQDYATIVAKQKENARIYNEYTIDVKNSLDLTQKIFSAASQDTAEFKNDCNFLRELCDQVTVSAAELKSIIPVDNGVNEVKAKESKIKELN